MGKIAKTQSAKHEASLSPHISDFIKTSTSIPLWDLPAHLSSFPVQWPFPRGDLYHWIPLLNHFDDILDLIILAYGLRDSLPNIQYMGCEILSKSRLNGDHMQELLKTSPEGVGLEFLKSKGFAEDGDRVLVESMIDFSTLLIDNCGNRSLYASAPLLGDLLDCPEQTIVAAVLRLTLRLAGRYSAARLRHRPGGQLPVISNHLLLQHYNLSLHKVDTLAQPFIKGPPETQQSGGTDTPKHASQPSSYAPDLISSLAQDTSNNLRDLYGVAWLLQTASDPPAQTETWPQPSSSMDTPSTPTPVRHINTQGSDLNSQQAQTSPTQSRAGASETSKSDSRTIEISAEQLRSSNQDFAHLLQKHLPTLSPVQRYQLLCRMRIGRAFQASLKHRQEAVAVRVLAIANLVHIYPEAMLQEKVLWQDAGAPRQNQIAYQLRDLIYSPGRTGDQVPTYIQAFALAALEALTIHKNKAGDVLACLDVNVSHGSLAYILRKTVTDMSDQGHDAQDKWNNEYRNALFSFLPLLPRNFPRASESMAGTAICEILMEALALRTPTAELNYHRILAFLDVFIYNTREAFPALVNAKGLDVTADLLVHEVDVALAEVQADRGVPSASRTQFTDYKIPFVQQQILRTLFRFISHTMTFNTIGFDRLIRNLIESAEVLAALRKVVASPTLYGSTVWCGALRILSDFLNAEPTSYAAVAEAGLTRAFLETVTQRALPQDDQTTSTSDDAKEGDDTAQAHPTQNVFLQPHPLLNDTLRVVDPSQPDAKAAQIAMEDTLSQGIIPCIEAIISVPMGLGSICLNDAGLDQLKKSHALRTFFLVFYSSPHVKLMAAAGVDEIENLGAQFDELVRHHPRLKDDIIRLIWNMTDLLAKRGAQTHVPAQAPEDVEMTEQPAEVAQTVAASTSNASGPLRGDAEARQGERATTVEYVLVYGKFLLGFFSNPSLVQPFSETPGIGKLVDLVTASSLPYNFGTSSSAQKIAKLFQIFVDSKPHLVLPRLARRLQNALHDLEPFIGHTPESPYFVAFVTPPESHDGISDLQRQAKDNVANVTHEMLVVQVTGLILAKCLPNPPHRTSPNGFAAVNLTDVYNDIISLLGRLQGRCIWESIILEQSAPPGLFARALNQPGSSTIGVGLTSISLDLPQQSENGVQWHETDQSASDDAQPLHIALDSEPIGASGSGRDTPKSFEPQNLVAIRHLLNHIPASSASLFLMIGKSLLMKRLPAESYQKQNSTSVAEHIGQALLQVLQFTPPPAKSDKALEYYRYISISLATQVLVERRSDMMDRDILHVLSLVVQAFHRSGGLTLIGKTAQELFERSIINGPDTLDDAQIKGPKSGQRCSYEGLQAALRFLVQVTSQKNIAESAQAEAMSRQERDKSSPDYFSKGQFLVEMRLDAIRSVKPIWEAEQIDQASTGTITQLCAILKNVLEAHGEQGAIHKTDNVSVRRKPVRKFWKMRQPDSVARLASELEVDAELVREALFRCCELQAAAKEYCKAYKLDPTLTRNPIPTSELPPDEEASADATRTDALDPLAGDDFPILRSSSPQADDDNQDIVRQIISRIQPIDSSRPADSSETQKAQDADITTLQDLDELRSTMQGNVMDRALLLLSIFKNKNLMFELADLITAAVSKGADAEGNRVEAIETLMHSLISFQDRDIVDTHKEIALFAHLLGILLQDAAMFLAARETLKESFGVLTSFLRFPTSHRSGDAAEWMCNVLLILERVLSEDAQPRKIDWSPPPADQPPPKYEPIATLEDPMVSSEEKQSLFTQMIDILPKIGKDTRLGLAVVRVLLILTRDRKLAKTLGDTRNMARFFLMVRQLLAGGMLSDNLQMSIMLILRHIVEDEESVRHIMRNDIRSFFANQSRGVEPSAYTRQLYHLVLRDPEIFVQVTDELLMLSKYDRPTGSPQLTLKKLEEPETAKEEDEDEEEAGATKSGKAKDTAPSVEMEAKDAAAAAQEKPKTNDMKPPVVENPDGVIHFLLAELLAYKDVLDKPPEQPDFGDQKGKGAPTTANAQDTEMSSDATQSQSSAGPVGSNPSENLEQKDHFGIELPEVFKYRTFLLSALTELLHSYNRAKVEFINFSRRADPQAATPSKPRSGVLNYLLNGLIPNIPLQRPENFAAERNAATSYAAVGTIVALCSKTPERRSSRHDTLEADEEPELLFVRRFVLEHALKAYRDTMSSPNTVDAKYAKLLTLADLFSRMLGSHPDLNHRSARDPAAGASLMPAHKQLAKLMFEKNFIAALNSSMVDVDLNVPGAHRAVKYILRPLNLLTHTAVALSLTSSLSASSGQTDEDDISSATSVSDAGDNEREETPNLFRNSTLGMFEPGGGEDGSESSAMSDEEDEEGMYDDAYADDMEYDDEEHTHGEDVVSDEDEEMEGIGPIEGIPGDIPMELQIDIEHDHDDDSDSDDEDEDGSEDCDDEDEDDDGDNIEIMEEIIDDDGASADGDQQVDEWEDEAEDEDEYHDMEEVHEIDEHAESASENDIEPYHNGSGALGVLGANVGDLEDVLDEDGVAENDSEEGDEEEAENFDEDEEMDFDAAPFDEEDGDGEPQPFRLWPPHAGRRHIHHRAHRHHWNASLHAGNDVLAGGFHGQYRPFMSGRAGEQAARNTGETRNPLLSRPGPSEDDSRRESFGLGQEAQHPNSLDIRRLLQHLQPGGFGGDQNAQPYAYIEQLFNVLSHGGQPIGIQHGVDGAVSISLNPGQPMMGNPLGELEALSAPNPANPRTAPGGPRASRNVWKAVLAEPITTAQRWQDEAKLLFGAEHAQKCLFVIGAFLRLLVGPAILADQARREKERKAQEERDRIRAEREAQERKEREEREAQEAARKAEAEAAAAAAEAEAAARRQAEGPSSSDHPQQRGEGGENSGESDDKMQGVESTTQQEEGSSAAAAASADAPRVFTNIRGRQVDITSLGIDVEVLESLPEEMREEVIAQQYVEQRTTAHVTGEAEDNTTIDSEFLDALPPDIREEIVQQEAQERRRRERDEARRRSQAAGSTAQPEEIDPASFMASLDPGLRATVLAEADDDMLASLPADMAAEARALGSQHRRRAVDSPRILGRVEVSHLRRRSENQDQADDDNVSAHRRPIVQMVDKAGIAILLRLMFVPITGSSRSSLSGILRNACGNRQTRYEVISGLLAILQDGSIDVSAMERSFTQLTVRARSANSASKTPQSARKQQPAQALPGSDTNPNTVISQSLSVLVDLVRYINHVPQFFLSKNEVFGATRSKTGRKGKAKENEAAKYPINALLTLLDREFVINSVSIMEPLAFLLSSVTSPLNALVRKQKDDQNQEKKAEEAPDARPAADQDTAMAGTGTTAEMTSNSDEKAEEKPSDKPSEPKKPRELVPPEIPEENLRLVVNILSARDCTSKTFRDTLSTMTYLSAIPNARNVFGNELINQARKLGERMREKLSELAKALEGAETEMEAQSVALANFSTTGSDQSKFNRILTALDYLYEDKSGTQGENGANDKAETLQSDGELPLADLYDDDSFIDLWQQLSGCLSATQKPETYFLNVATILLPLIEALMVVCKRIPANKSRKQEPEQQQASVNKMRAVFFAFTDNHRKILNDLVRNNPKLMSGSFSVLVKNSSVLEFDNKRNYFNRRLHYRGPEQRHHHHPPLPVNVRREHVFSDSFNKLCYRKAEEIKYGKLNVHFAQEEGVDAGGVTREWFQILAREMFNPGYALFNPVASDRTTFHPNPLSEVNPEHIRYLQFIGRFIGKALYENRVLDCHFSRAVYKRILGKAVSMKDMETIDLDYAKSMEWILHNDITDVITETFSLAIDKFGVEVIVDLVENGRNVPVTEENKEEYVRLVTEYKLLGSVKDQLESFLQGFHDIVPAELISIFDEGELELLISGMPDVDIDDWKINTEYHGYNANSPQIQWFWRAVRSFDAEERAKLLQFVTGTGKVPLNGFKELEGMNGFTRFSIHKEFGNKDRLPSSHTCFNQLDLPEYDNYEMLRKSLYTAITTGADFFGLI